MHGSCCTFVLLLEWYVELRRSHRVHCAKRRCIGCSASLSPCQDSPPACWLAMMRPGYPWKSSAGKLLYPTSGNVHSSSTACFQGALKGTNLRGQTEPKRRFSLIFADSRLFLENDAFGQRRLSQKTADFRRKPQENAGTRRKPQIGVCPLRLVPLSAALCLRTNHSVLRKSFLQGYICNDKYSNQGGCH